ncbi:MAG: hypothetical protein HZC15_06520 [Candidatus Omnitrophica bacterium]|nr:hypothetical protein [Candidatus Omnitrophota bacterium]
MSSWQVVLLEPARTVLTQIGQFLVNVLLVLIILVIGWIISRMIKAVVTKGLRLLRIDAISEKIELDSILEKGGIAYSLSELLGVICYWLAILVTFVVALSTVNLITPSVLDRVVSYIPNVIVSVFLLILGMFLANMLKNIVVAAANNAGLRQGKLLGNIVSFLIVAFAILVALEQLKIGVRITELTLSIILGTVGLGLALSFGLGCREIAGKFVADLVETIKKK